MIPPDAYGDTPTRVMVALIAAYEAEGRATVRAVAARTGRSINCTHRALMALRRVGLVTWADGTSGTLRPLVHPVAVGS